MTLHDSDVSSSSGPSDRGVYRTTIDLDEEPFEWAIYEAVSTALDLDAQTDEIPVANHVNPDALASLFTEDSGTTYVSFPVKDARVTVRSDGRIEVDRT